MDNSLNNNVEDMGAVTLYQNNIEQDDVLETLLLDDNAMILGRYMIILFMALLVMWGTILYYSYKLGSSLTYIISIMILVVAIFGAWGLYYQNTGKPFLLYDRDNINMPLQHISFLIMIILIVSYALYIGYTYEIQ